MQYNCKRLHLSWAAYPPVMNTLDEIARRANVSPGTVSRILNGKIRGAYSKTATRVELVQRLAKELNYRPSAAARAMATRRTGQIGVLVRNAHDNPLNNLQLYETILGINDRLEETGRILSLVSLDDFRHGDPSSESRVFRERVLEGMIVCDVHPHEVYQVAADMVRHCLWMDSNHWQPERCLRRDEEDAGYCCAKALADGGADEILWIRHHSGDGVYHYSETERLRGVERALAGRQTRLRILACRPDEALPAELLPRLAAGAGLVASYYLMAQRIANLAAGQGLRPGVDYLVACCDGDHGALLGWPDLSRVCIDRFAMGRQAADMLLSMMGADADAAPSRLVRGTWFEGATARWDSGPGSPS